MEVQNSLENLTSFSFSLVVELMNVSGWANVVSHPSLASTPEAEAGRSQVWDACRIHVSKQTTCNSPNIRKKEMIYISMNNTTDIY